MDEVVSLAQGKRSAALALAIGIPGPGLGESVLGLMRAYAAERPEDRVRLAGVLRGRASKITRSTAPIAGRWRTRRCPDRRRSCSPTSCARHPAAEDARTDLPPRAAVSVVDARDHPWPSGGAWQTCARPGPVLDGTPVVLALDGSFNNDTTAVVACSIEETPHLDIAALWGRPPSPSTARTTKTYRVPIADVEDAIRQACRCWAVREVVADLYRWARSLQALESSRACRSWSTHRPRRG